MNFGLHFLAGALITSTPISIEYAASAMLVAAVGKELYDRRHGGRFDSRDVLVTVAGSAPVIYFRWEW